MSSALIQGANGSTQDINIWFEDESDPRIGEAAREAGGFWVSEWFGMRPPALGGKELSTRFDVVIHMHGLAPFEKEHPCALAYVLEGIEERVLPLERIVASKRATGRPKDLAQLPALEEALAAIADETPNDEP